MAENNDYLLGMVCVINALNPTHSLKNIIDAIRRMGKEVSDEAIKYIREEFAPPHLFSDGTVDENIMYALKSGGYHVLRPKENHHLVNKTINAINGMKVPNFRYKSPGQIHATRHLMRALSDTEIDSDKLQRYIVCVSTSFADCYYEEVIRSDCFITYNTPNFEAGMLEVLRNNDRGVDIMAQVFDIFDNVHHSRISRVLDLEPTSDMIQK
jgi:hypothetical protein